MSRVALKTMRRGPFLVMLSLLLGAGPALAQDLPGVIPVPKQSDAKPAKIHVKRKAIAAKPAEAKPGQNNPCENKPCRNKGRRSQGRYAQTCHCAGRRREDRRGKARNAKNRHRQTRPDATPN